MKHSIVKWLMSVLMAAGSGSTLAQPEELITAAAELQTLPREFRLDGVVEATNKTTISAQTSGQVQEILYDVNDVVEKDSVLVVLKDTEQQANVSRAAADLKAAVAHLQEARDAYQRTKEIFAKELVAESAMDSAEAALYSAKAKYESAEAGLAQTKEQLEYTRIRAPYSGIVTQRHVEVGEVAQPGQPLMDGISLDKLRVLVDVPQSLVPRIREFGQARVERPGAVPVEAVNLTVFPFADTQSSTFKIRVDLPEGTANLFPGMFVKIAFMTGKKQELVLPSDAVVHRSEVTAVYVVGDDGKVAYRHVRVGRKTDAGGVLVLAGVVPGERVALDPIAAGVELKRQRVEKNDG